MSNILRALFSSHTSNAKAKQNDEESASPNENSPLINANGSSTPSKVLKANELSTSSSKDSKDDGNQKKSTEAGATDKGGWIGYVRRFSIFLPYIWPSNNRLLQLRLLGVVFCLIIMRVFKVLAPRQLGIVFSSLDASFSHIPLQELGLYLLYNWIESSGVLNTIKGYLWLPVEQNAHKSVTLAAYDRVMMLSCDFHDEKKSGELFKSIEQGHSIYGLFETILFRLLPMVFDLAVACVYLSSLFGWYMTLIVGAATAAYIWAIKYFTEKQVDCARTMTKTTRAESQAMYDTVGCWVSVAYFDNFAYERKRYSGAVVRNLESQFSLYMLHYLSGIVSDSALEIGFAGAFLLAIYQISNGTIEKGSLVVLTMYWGTFTGPLAIFGYIQRSLQQNLIEAEQLLELLKREPTVKDGPAKFELTQGAVKFNAVNFSYDGTKPILKDLEFSVSPGQTVALVGETGSGKSTILKLLFRLYDVTSGSIKIDGQDLRGVTLESLRQFIGVVPQDPVLFNDTIMNNVRYARLDATDAEVVEACTAAAIHFKISTFTNGYESLVGENGVKLSGGEIQRVAIARAILKDPKIILLDEATSAVDSQTESQIQTALRRLTHGRTTFVVAHRLSTVIDADLMLVIQDGSIEEQGPPKELLKSKGEFHNLWSMQNIAAE